MHDLLKKEKEERNNRCSSATYYAIILIICSEQVITGIGAWNPVSKGCNLKKYIQENIKYGGGWHKI